MKTENISDPSWKHIQERDKRIAELEAENARLQQRCFPSKIIMIGETGHYVSDAVYAEIKRMRQVVEATLRYTKAPNCKEAHTAVTALFIIAEEYEATKP